MPYWTGVVTAACRFLQMLLFTLVVVPLPYQYTGGDQQR